MIISEKKDNTSARREKGIIAAGVVFLSAFVLWFILFSNRKEGEMPQQGIIFCNAEKAQGDLFVQGDFEFSGGNLQSDEKSRSGNYSCKVGTGKGIQYGFGYQLKGGKPGEVYKISVWRYKTPQKEGRLVVQNSGGSAFYQMEEIPVAVEASGWEQLSTTFAIPFGDPPDYYNIYVYASGFHNVFFDDLTIEKTGTWPSNVMNPQALQIRVEPKGLEKLERKREKALVEGLLQTSDNDWVKAVLSDSTGNEIPAQVRLKGDWTDHLEGDKWSFRIKVKDPYSWKYSKNAGQGLITFSVHTPATRYFLHEWLVHQCWMDEGILTPRYDFTAVSLNGKSLGIYAMEEHFDKQLVESQQRREGPILKFSEEGMWSGIERQLQNQGYIHNDYRSTVGDWDNAEAEAFGQQDFLSDTLLSRQYEKARQLMFDFKNDLLPAKQVFDLEKLARFYAIADVFNAYHGIIWHNQRFYYNPVIGKLEPIGYDAFGGKPPRRYTILGEGALNPEEDEANRLFGYLLQDKDFNELYFKFLYHYSSRKFLSNFLEKHQISWNEKLALLQLEFPEYQPNYKAFLEDGLFVHSMILPYNDQSIKAFTQQLAGGKKNLSIQNTHQLPVEIIGSGYSRGKMDTPLNKPLQLPAHVRRRYLSRILRDSLISDFDATKFLHSEALVVQRKGEIKALEVIENARFLFFRVPGIDSVFTSQIFDWPRPEIVQMLPFNKEQPSPVLRENTLYVIKGKQILFRKGKHILDQPLVIPPDYEVFIQEDTEIDLKNGAYIMSYGPMQVSGSGEHPVRVTSSDKTGRGLSLLQSSKPSAFQYVIFEQLGTLSNNGQQLTGAVTGYECDIRFYKCTFRNNHCEDALNLVRTDFVLENCLFSGISSDAFDSDFSKGEVKNCTFNNITNDAMDFSGSTVNIYNCRTKNTGDKGISCGEQSDIAVFETTIDTSPIAVASKDLSVLFLRDITLKNCIQGFVAFQKKPEFGPGKIIVESHTAINIEKLFNIGEGSFLQMNEK